MDDVPSKVDKPSLKSALRLHFRILTFQATSDELVGLNTSHLALGLLWTWLVGIGRWWDDPDAYLIQGLGLGSVAYVFILSVVLWLTLLLLRPNGLTYLRTLTYVTLTAPPALLYAIPVERWYGVDTANGINAWFLGVVALWRVAVFHRFLWKGAHLPGFYGLLGMLFPIAVTITVLAQLNLERSTWELMAGIRQTTAADLSYQWLFLLTVISVYSMAVVIPVYLICCAFRFADMRKKEKPAPNIDDDEGRAA